MLSAEDLLAGSSLTFDIEIPAELLAQNGREGGRMVRLRPLTVSDLQLISRAARDNEQLTAALMIQRSLVEPEMSSAQVATMPVGLAQFLLKSVNRISGIELAADELSGAVHTPLVQAAFILAREFGWTPEQVSALTVGQVLLHLEMLKEHGIDHGG